MSWLKRIEILKLEKLLIECEKSGPNDEYEKLFAIDPILSYRYANKILKGRFYHGEKTISDSPIIFILYVIKVLKFNHE